MNKSQDVRTSAHHSTVKTTLKIFNKYTYKRPVRNFEIHREIFDEERKKNYSDRINLKMKISKSKKKKGER